MSKASVWGVQLKSREYKPGNKFEIGPRRVTIQIANGDIESRLICEADIRTAKCPWEYLGKVFGCPSRIIIGYCINGVEWGITKPGMVGYIKAGFNTKEQALEWASRQDREGWGDWKAQRIGRFTTTEWVYKPGETVQLVSVSANGDDRRGRLSEGPIRTIKPPKREKKKKNKQEKPIKTGPITAPSPEMLEAIGREFEGGEIDSVQVESLVGRIVGERIVEERTPRLMVQTSQGYREVPNTLPPEIWKTLNVTGFRNNLRVGDQNPAFRACVIDARQYGMWE